MKAKAGSLINSINLYSDYLKESEREIANTMTQRSNITTDSPDIKRITSEYYGHLYASKFNKLDEMENLFERCKPPKLTQEEIDNLNTSICLKDITSVVKNLPSSDTLCLDCFTGEFYQISDIF